MAIRLQGICSWGHLCVDVLEGRGRSEFGRMAAGLLEGEVPTPGYRFPTEGFWSDPPHVFGTANGAGGVTADVIPPLVSALRVVHLLTYLYSS
jgi:hypothetical protein